MTLYRDENSGLADKQKNQIIELMDIFNIRCIEKRIDNIDQSEIEFKPILYKNTVYYITMNTIMSLIEVIEFKHIEINQNGFITFVFKPINKKVFEEIQELSYRDR